MESFLIRNHFKEIEQEERSSSKVKRRRWKMSKNPIENTLPQPEWHSEDEISLVNVLENIKKKGVRRKKECEKGRKYTEKENRGNIENQW